MIIRRRRRIGGPRPAGARLRGPAARATIHIYIYIYVYVCIDRYIHTYVCIYIYIYVYIYIYTRTHVYMYVYIYIYIYVYTHTCIHMFFAERLRRRWVMRGAALGGGSGQTGWWPERRSKGASERTKGKNATTCRAQPRLLLPRNALSRSRRRGPQLPFRYLQGTNQRDYRRRRSDEVSVSRPVRAGGN